MGTKHNATGDVEREFSVMNLIHQNKQRNKMSQDSLNSHLHIRSGVESKENRSKCSKCLDPNSPVHCHCLQADITDSMRQKCKKAWEKCKQAQREAAEEKKEASEASKDKLEKSKKEENERILKFKEVLASKPTFGSPNLLKPVYPPEKKSKEIVEQVKENDSSRKSESKKRKTSQSKSSKKPNETNSSKKKFVIPKENSKNASKKPRSNESDSV